MTRADSLLVRGLGRLPLATALIWAVLVPAAFAATEAGDAGERPATAQDLGAETALDAITGSIANESDRDMYRLCASGAGSFSASTVDGTAIDTQLFLLDAGGRGVYANDDAPGVMGQSELPAGDPLTPATAGVYYLAISRYNQDPLNAAGSRLFADVVFTIGPASSNPGAVIASWGSGRTGSVGDYRIALTGVVPCPEPDTTSPTVDLRTPPDGATYTRGEQVAADYDCADEGSSGLESCVGSVADGAPIDTASAGEHSFSVTARDAAGNETAVSHSYTVLDSGAPTIDLRTPADGADYARGEQVLADYDCADEDGGSGLASCAGDVPDGEPIDTAALGPHSFTVTARDSAGNETVVSHGYTVTDVSAPTIDLRTPADGATYALGEQVLADYECADEDGGSGLASCVGDVPDGEPIDTAIAGAHSFSVHATDAAGNASERTVSYSVQEDAGGGFEFEGFLVPLRNPPVLNRVWAGSIVPVRFRLGGDQGDDVIADGFPRSGKVDCGEDADPDTAKPTRSPWWWQHRLDGGVSYHPWRKTYVYLWQTNDDWAGSCRQLIVKLSDGSLHRANIEFPRRHSHHWFRHGHGHEPRGEDAGHHRRRR
ncbi:MAG TPA: PxKF domain-containing protein [Thermoleophilaceae bacterium]